MEFMERVRGAEVYERVEKGSDQQGPTVCGLQGLFAGLRLRQIPPGRGVRAGQRPALLQAFRNLRTLHLSRAQKYLKKLQECNLQQRVWDNNNSDTEAGGRNTVKRGNANLSMGIETQ